MKLFMRPLVIIAVLVIMQGCSNSLAPKAKALEDGMRQQGVDNCKTLGISDKNCKFN